METFLQEVTETKVVSVKIEKWPAYFGCDIYAFKVISKNSHDTIRVTFDRSDSQIRVAIEESTLSSAVKEKPITEDEFNTKLAQAVEVLTRQGTREVYKIRSVKR